MDETHPAQTFAAPRGMRDFYPEDMHLRRRVFDAWRTASERHGFQEYDACVVESMDLLRRKGGEEIADQIYCFTDKSGRELALRAEMTPTLARMVAARQGSLPFPLKWFTIAQCFRYERTTRGRKREHYQWNLDIVGDDSVAAEVDVLSTAASALTLLGLGPSEYRIRVNSRALLADLFARLAIPPPLHSAGYLAMDKRGKVEDGVITDLLREAGMSAEQSKGVLSLLEIRSMEEAAGVLGGKTPALERMERFMDLASAAGLGPVLQFDAAVIRGLAYYTGIVFEAFDTGGQLRAILGGGRYDNLLAQVGGRPASGVGLGFGDVVIGEILSDLGKLPPPSPPAGVAIAFMQEEQHVAALRLAADMRSTGQAVDLALGAEKAKAFFTRAARAGYAQAIYVGPDDVARGIARIKDMATRTEREVPIPWAAPAGS